MAMAREFALKWMKAADNGEQYRLAFGRKDRWSQKYSRGWDRVLGLDIFPSSVRPGAWVS